MYLYLNGIMSLGIDLMSRWKKEKALSNLWKHENENIIKWLGSIIKEKAVRASVVSYVGRCV
jgi:hypothetical protein